MATNAGKPPEAWRNYSTKVPIPAFRIKREELKRLYGMIDSKQLEYRDKIVANLSKLPSETDQDFTARKQKVYGAFVTSVTATSLDDEMLHGNNSAFFESSTFPERLKSILISTRTVPQAVLNLVPLCNILVFLDFTRPPLFDFGRLPTLPTPNESNFELSADDESWFAATKARLSQFFSDRRTSTNWIHRAAIYDLLLIFVGVPIAIWADFRLVGLIDSRRVAPFIISALYVYVFFVIIVLFRLLFSYSRWVFPKVELDTELASPARHRGIWGAVVLALLGSLIYDILKALAGW